ncbi:hypothetical protein BGX23_012374 [Mortierella sp. AD031]|nr:hypothetical protein BGX23_012374 [Mortierella sp. AD031]KAG0198361.1 hypothetical protein BGX33_012375 [Mortierella sp. NVP41]
MILPDIQVVLVDPNMVGDESLRADKYRGAFFDPGIENTVTVAIFRSSDTNHIKNIAVTRGSWEQPSKFYRRGFEEAKANHRIPELESTIQPIKFTQATDDAEIRVWSEIFSSTIQHLISVLRVHNRLRTFYSSPLYKIKSRHQKQADNATLNRSIDRAIHETAGSQKYINGVGVRTLFGFGDGAFGSRTGKLMP